ncbi:MAG: acyl-CoA reductase [Lachnospiraceae bacterium]
MILFDGKIYSDKEQDMVLDQLWEYSVRTVSDRKEVFQMASMVIDACGVLAGRIRSGEYDEIILPLLAKGTFTREQMEEAVSFFERENLLVKYETELGVWFKNMTEYVDEQSVPTVRIERRLEPLGILFHIAAGNAQGLPFYSVIEGMIAGNVNILKLPSADDGLSVLLLHEMIEINPELAPYVCVLDVPSTNLTVMKRLEQMADAVVVWGGDEAVKAVRTMADTKTQIISWGHKLSFAYVTQDAAEEELTLLARHICVTRQLLCNSCQGIFVDTEDEETVLEVGKRFLKILESENAGFPKESIGVRGKVGILLYNEELESIRTGKKVLRGDGVSVTVSTDSNLELSFLFKNCWVKPLPRKNIVRALKDKKGHLQTVGLVCGEKEREELADLFIKAGVTHVTRAGRMAHSTAGAAHDGEYPLRRYTRIVEVE